MSSEGNKKSDSVDIYFADAVRFFKSIEEAAKCPVCSAVSWEIPLSAEGKPVTLLDSGFYLGDVPQLELKLSCNKCGFYRSHSAAVIRKWLADNPVKGDDTDA